MPSAPMVLPEPLAAVVREYAALTSLDTDTALAVLITSGANTASDDPGRPRAVAVAFAYGVQAERERSADAQPRRAPRRASRGTARLSLVVSA